MNKSAPFPITATDPAPNSLAGSLNLKSGLALLSRQRRVIVAISVLGTILTALILSQLDRQYTATSLVLVDPRETALLGGDVGAQGLLADVGIETELEIARSPAVASRVLREIILPDYQLFAPLDPIPVRIGRWLGLSGSGSELEHSRWEELGQVQRAELLERFADAVTVRRRRMTRIIAISARADTPREAATLANLVAESYIEEQLDAKLVATRRAALLIGRQVEVLAGELERAERALDSYLVESESKLGSADAQSRLAGVRAEIAGLVAERRKVLDESTKLEIAISSGQATETLDYLTIEDARRLREAREMALARLGDPRDPSPVRDQVSRYELETLEREIEDLASKRVSTLRAQLASTDVRTTELGAQLQALLDEQQIPNEIAVRVYSLQRDAETRRQLYQESLTRLRQVEQQISLIAPDSRLVARATPPLDPSFPPSKAIFATATLAWLALAFGVAFIRDHYIGGFLSVEHVQAETKLPVISAIPLVVAKEGLVAAEMILEAPLSAFSESIRQARFGLEDLVGSDRTCFLITSTVPREGKSTFALSYSRYASVSGKSALLIDADLRHPSVYMVTTERPKHALLGYLRGDVESDRVEDLIVQDARSGLDLIFSEEAPIEPSEVLLRSARFGHMIAWARRNYDLVVLDTSPAGLTVDAMILARHADALVLVVEWAATSQSQVVSTVRGLQRHTDIRAGIVLNKVAQTGPAYHEYYGEAYRRG